MDCRYDLVMQRLQAFKFQLVPSGFQESVMRRFAGSCRFAYNKALDLQKARFEAGEKKLSYAGLCKALTQWRHDEETKWLQEAPSQALQQKLKDLERAYTNFFAKRADFPRFKKKGQSESFRYPDPRQIKLDQENSRIFLPKLGWLRYRNSRVVLGELSNVTVTRRAGNWFISIQTERSVEVAAPKGDPVGVDMGITRFATISDGTVYESINSYRKHQTALKKAQQRMSRKEKHSKNWKKAKAIVQGIHARISNVRHDFLHKLSTLISKNHAIVCVEDLQVSNMSRSASGTIESPGTNVQAKSGLNKSILDQGWSEFHRQLDYKLAWSGGWLVKVPPHKTSQMCPACNYVSKENRKTQAGFCCGQCGFEENADLVGAINILRAGLARLACQANGSTRRQQEPAEALLVL